GGVAELVILRGQDATVESVQRAPARDRRERARGLVLKARLVEVEANVTCVTLAEIVIKARTESRLARLEGKLAVRAVEEVDRAREGRRCGCQTTAQTSSQRRKRCR